MLEAFTCSFDTPKFAAMGEVQYDIVDLGGLNLTSTDFGERSHKDIKAAVPFNNHHKDDELRQVTPPPCCLIALSDAHNTAACQVQLMPPQWSLQAALSTLPATCKSGLPADSTHPRHLQPGPARVHDVQHLLAKPALSCCQHVFTSHH